MEARIPYETCPLCGSADREEVMVASCTGYPLYKPELPPTMRWLRCRACDHVYVDGYFTEEALGVLFSESHPGQSPGQDVEPARYVSAKIVESVSALRPALGGRWLDVGFGNGSLLTTAAEFGFDVTGIDLREDSVRRMQALGFEAVAVDLARYEPPGALDVISMADVLEHMPFPGKALRRAHGLLAEGGLLFLSMPNSDSFLWSTLTKNGVNPYWAELEHYHNFGRKRLYRLLEEHGFTPRHYAVSVRYRACMEVIAQKVTPRSPNEGVISGLPRPAQARSSPLPRRPAGDVRLNLGCGRSPMAGWVNIDSADLPGVDVVVNLEGASLPFEDSSVTEINASHLIEHIRDPLALMQELHRVAKAGARATFRVPYGSSDDADEDPTHVRRYHWGSWGYFSQPHYWRADYGYRGDWDVEDVVLVVDQELKGTSWAEAFREVQRRRNVVKEMIANLRAVKPIRPADRALQRQTLVRFVTSE